MSTETETPSLPGVTWSDEIRRAQEREIDGRVTALHAENENRRDRFAEMSDRFRKKGEENPDAPVTWRELSTLLQFICELSQAINDDAHRAHRESGETQRAFIAVTDFGHKQGILAYESHRLHEQMTKTVVEIGTRVSELQPVVEPGEEWKFGLRPDDEDNGD